MQSKSQEIIELQNKMILVKNFFSCAMSYGEYLRQKRNEARLTQEQLAKRAGISANYVSALERDEPNARDGSPRRPRIEKVERIAKALSVDPNEALDAAGYKGEPKKPTTAKEALELIAKMIPGFEGVLLYDGLTDENAERLLEDFKTLMELQNRRAKKESDI